MLNAMDMRISAIRADATDVKIVDIVAGEGELPEFQPGAHIDIEFADMLTRQYSLCNDSTERHRYQIAVLRERHSRGGSAYLHDTAVVGTSLKVSPPKNHFPLHPTTGRSMLLAGGIGITPLLCMARALGQSGSDYTLHYSARNAGCAAFRSTLQSAEFQGRVKFYFSGGEVGRRMDMQAVLARPAIEDHLYVCGPQRFIEAALSHAAEAGWAAGHVHREFFSGVDSTVANAVGSFRVRIASSGAYFNVPPGQSIADVLMANGIPIQVSCAQGVCGTCLTGLLAGEPEHHDLFLTEEEHAMNNQITPCCARSKSSLLVLDL